MTTLDQITREMDEILDAESQRIRRAASSDELEEVRRTALGKKGRLSTVLRSMGQLPAEDRPAAGKASNAAKERLQAALESRAEELRAAELEHALAREAIDVTLPGVRPRVGALHPLTRTLREIEDIFVSMGFSIEEGPEVEDDFHNFEALNIDADHPARDMHDTFYMRSGHVLRTHTSPVQIHVMQERRPPLAVIAPGKVYRCDADVTHSPMFHQVEGLLVDEMVRFSDLKGVLESFIHQMFGPDTPYRFRPSYFPFTEPSAEVDIFFERPHPSGHVVRDWLEILGAGMVHPRVLEQCDLDPEHYTGFAFGMGVERIAMIKHGINTIGVLFENDARFLAQFR